MMRRICNKSFTAKVDFLCAARRGINRRARREQSRLKQRSLCGLCCLLFVIGLSGHARADTFGGDPNNTFEIEFVPIGSPGNPGDPTGSPFLGGAVDYRYRIGKYEVSEEMVNKANAESATAGEPLNITHDGRGPNFPATSIGWFEAAQFVNWLNVDAGFPFAYKFDALGNFELWNPNDPGFNPNNQYRNTLARYVLPSAHEWYKAAYYDPINNVYYDYPTGSDSVPDGIDFVNDPDFEAVFFDGEGNPGPSNTNPAPNDITNVGVLSPFGTAGQGGNVTEWEESSADLLNDSPLSGRGYRGGGWGNIWTHLLASNRNAIGPAFEADFFGFRVVRIPEPSTLLLLLLLAVAVEARTGKRFRDIIVRR